MRITSNDLLLRCLVIVWLSAPFLLPGSGPEIVANDVSTNLRIDGEGYFVIQDKETGKLLLTRFGLFRIDWDGFLSLQNRYRVMGLDPLSQETGPLYIGPENNLGNGYSSNGVWYALPILDRVSILTNGVIRVGFSDGSERDQGQIRLWRSPEPDKLIPKEDTQFVDPALGFGGEDQMSSPGGNGAGWIRSGELELPEPRITMVAFDRAREPFKRRSVFRTSTPTHLVIEGPGFFELRDPMTDKRHLTQCGAFKIDWDGWLVASWNGQRVQGRPVVSGDFENPVVGMEPRDIRLPQGAPDGRVIASTYVVLDNGLFHTRLSDGTVAADFQLVVREVPDPNRLIRAGNQLYETPEEDGFLDQPTIRVLSYGLSRNHVDEELLPLLRSQQRFVQGAIARAENPAFLAVSGDGLFIVRDPMSGRRLFTRVGMFGWSAEGCLVTMSGWRVQGWSPRIDSQTAEMIRSLPGGDPASTNSLVPGNPIPPRVEPPLPGPLELESLVDIRLEPPVSVEGSDPGVNVDSEGWVTRRGENGAVSVESQIWLARIPDATEFREVFPLHFDCQRIVPVAPPGSVGLGRIVPGAIEEVWKTRDNVPASAPVRGVEINSWGLAGRRVYIQSVSEISILDSSTHPNSYGFPWNLFPINAVKQIDGGFHIEPQEAMSQKRFFRLAVTPYQESTW